MSTGAMRVWWICLIERPATAGMTHGRQRRITQPQPNQPFSSHLTATGAGGNNGERHLGEYCSPVGSARGSREPGQV